MYLREYLGNFRREIEKLEEYGFSEALEIREELRANKQAVISANIVFFDGSSLHIKEYIDARYKIDRISYAYHYQDNRGNRIFRYDNAVHKPPLGFEAHKHTIDGAVIEAALPEISDFVNEVIESFL